jgi:hypothetical protein
LASAISAVPEPAGLAAATVIVVSLLVSSKSRAWIRSMRP